MLSTTEYQGEPGDVTEAPITPADAWASNAQGAARRRSTFRTLAVRDASPTQCQSVFRDFTRNVVSGNMSCSFSPLRCCKGQTVIGCSEVTEPREDVSRFMVHLTRDDSAEWDGGGGDSARKNFLAIYHERTVLALKAHCLHARKMTRTQEEKCRVACFTEMPLSAIKHAAKPIPGRQVDLEPYGFVFTRDFIIEKGGQAVTYVNSYESTRAVRRSYDRVFEIAARNNFAGQLWQQLPFVSAMNERFDFFWEREWRVLGKVDFNYSDLVCVILPERGSGPLKFELAQKGISWISPEWGQERIVAELSDQQSRTRRLNFPRQKRKVKISRRPSKA